MKYFLTTILGTVAVLLSACAGTMIQESTQGFSRTSQARLFFEQIDAAIVKYEVEDASAFKVPGFPYLRTNRFLTAIKNRLIDRETENYWIEKMLAMDLHSRKKEFANLPQPAFHELSEAIGEPIIRETIEAMTAAYAQQLLNTDRSNPDFIPILKRAVRVPDEYSSMARVLGLYPLAGIPVTIGTVSAYHRYKSWHQTPLDELAILGKLIYYYPDDSMGGRYDDLRERIYDPSNLDILGLPILTVKDEKLLANALAPVLEQDIVKDYDRMGRITWHNGQVMVDPAKPYVYFYTTHSLLDGYPVLQINYAFWYIERAGSNAPWYERGPLDGVTMRVTLNKKGIPVLMDIMNSCGCYYFLVPQKKIVEKIIVKPGEIDPLVPAWLPPKYPAERINLRINSGWHQVQNISTHIGSERIINYKLVPYESLESLPKITGQMESVFTPRGILKDSWRIEPYIFFSMGIRDIGYMRQRGHHAIKFIGRGHFTDTDLFDQSIMFADPHE